MIRRMATPGGLKLTVHFGEGDREGRHLVSDLLMGLLADHGVLASALMRGVEGFGRKHALRTDRILTLSEDLPLVAIAVDRAERIEALLGGVSALVRTGLVTLERVAILEGPHAEDAPADLPGERHTKLTLYCGRGPRRVVPAALDLLREAGVPGATALLGLDGTILGGRRRGRVLSGNGGVPAIVISVGRREAMAGVLAGLRALAGEHVVTAERVHVMRRAGQALGELPATPAADRAGLGIWQRVSVFSGEQARWDGGPLHARLVRRLREEGAAGATVLRGFLGYSDDLRIHADRLLSVRRHTPVVVSLIDTPDAIARLWPVVVRATAATGLVTCEAIPAFHALGPGEARYGGLAPARIP
jgi:PII-like signaling protein